MNNIEISDLERAAMHGKPMPDGLSLIDQVYFQGLAYLYARFRAGMITREQGSEEKKKMLYARNEALREAEFGDRCRQHAIELWKRIESCASMYAKESTIEHADALYSAIYGIMRERT